LHFLPSPLLLGAAAVLTAAISPAQAPILLREYNGGFGANFGYSVAGAGDLDQDGLDDVIVGATRVNGDRGAAYAYSSADGSLLWTAIGESNYELFGWEVAPLGDVTGDGFPEVAVCAYGFDAPANTRGRVYILNGLDGSTVWQTHGCRWRLQQRWRA